MDAIEAILSRRSIRKYLPKLVTNESWKLEAQIIARILERLGLQINLNISSFPEFMRNYVYIPLLKKPPEEQDWDFALMDMQDPYAHTGTSLLAFLYLGESEVRWTQYDPVYDRLWRDMANTLDAESQEAKLRKLERYIHDNALNVNIYSPLTLYAVNRQVELVPQKFNHLRLKETFVTENHWSLRGKNN